MAMGTQVRKCKVRCGTGMDAKMAACLHPPKIPSRILFYHNLEGLSPQLPIK
jgi:hypothetical protein